MSDALTFFQAMIVAQIDEARRRSTDHGWRFQEHTFDQHTIGDLITAILAITTPEDARRFFDGYVADIHRRWPDEDALVVARSNIGWCFGEGMSNERQQMWITVCQASHPIFGQTMPTAEDALAAGMALGRKTR